LEAYTVLFLFVFAKEDILDLILNFCSRGKRIGLRRLSLEVAQKIYFLSDLSDLFGLDTGHDTEF